MHHVYIHASLHADIPGLGQAQDMCSHRDNDERLGCCSVCVRACSCFMSDATTEGVPHLAMCNARATRAGI